MIVLGFRFSLLILTSICVLTSTTTLNPSVEFSSWSISADWFSYFTFVKNISQIKERMKTPLNGFAPQTLFIAYLQYSLLAHYMSWFCVRWYCFHMFLNKSLPFMADLRPVFGFSLSKGAFWTSLMLAYKGIIYSECAVLLLMLLILIGWWLGLSLSVSPVL